jgi:pimeloyl-ACP methyl ester carboxylesterase
MPTSAARHYVVPAGPAPELDAPTPAGMTGELRTAVQVARLAAARRRLRRAPRGDGSPVVLVPGWKAPEASMAPLRTYLRSRGYDARHWGFGINRGQPERDAERMAQRLADVTAETGRPVALVGWSLGGVIAREAAREVPGFVEQVITYGTPTIGGPTYTIGARSFGRRESARITALLEQSDRDRPIQVPVTAIFTRRDRVVTWGACIDRASPQVHHLEVGSTHLGMGIDPDVWVAIAERLHAKRERSSG